MGLELIELCRNESYSSLQQFMDRLSVLERCEKWGKLDFQNGLQILSGFL